MFVVTMFSKQQKVLASTVYEHSGGSDWSGSITGYNPQYFLNNLITGHPTLGIFRIFVKWSGDTSFYMGLECYTGMNGGGLNNCGDSGYGGGVTVDLNGTNMAGQYVDFDFTSKNWTIPDNRYLNFILAPDHYGSNNTYVLGDSTNYNTDGGIPYTNGSWTNFQGLHDVNFSISDSNGFPIDFPFYAPIKNTGTDGYLELKVGTSTSTTTLKTLPEDWVVYVASTTNSTGNPIIVDGYRWYQVIDKTDNVSGWMWGSNASGTVQYLPYDDSKQAEFASTSSDFISSGTATQNLILTVINNYYATSTGPSLYDENTTISHLKDGDGYSKQIIPGIIAFESGGDGFNNDIVAGDYGHGIMQITFDSQHNPNTWDNRGVASLVTIPLCANKWSDLYLNCYGGSSPKYYKPYGGDSGQPTYKQYASTTQSIYANIKDGLHNLGYFYNYYTSNIPNISTTTHGTTFTGNDRRVISTTESFNDGFLGSNCGYVDIVADKLDTITSYFPTATTSEITDLIPKMHVAGGDMICADLHSPGNLSISDSQGRTVGVVNGKGENSFPVAIYDRERKFVKILAAEDDDYTYKIQGTGKGVYGLDITIKHGKEEVTFKAKNIPIAPKEVHTYSVDKEAIKNGQDGVTVKIDSNGDGKTDKTIKSGSTLTGSAFSKAELVN